MHFICKYVSPLGGITLASDGEALTGLWFDGQKYFAAGLSCGYEERDLPVFTAARKWLDIYFSGKAPDFTPPLSFDGLTGFRRRICGLLLAIPFGHTVTYGELAKRLEEETGVSTSARAIGGAVGHNRISLIVPCHRVTGADGSLTGYAGGIERKRALLELEHAVLPDKS